MLCCTLYAALQPLLHDATTVCMHESVVSICQRIENRFIFFFLKKIKKKEIILYKKKKRGRTLVRHRAEGLVRESVFLFVEKERKGKLSHLGVLLCQVRSIAYLSGPILSYTINDIASRYSIYLLARRRRRSRSSSKTKEIVYLLLRWGMSSSSVGC